MAFTILTEELKNVNWQLNGPFLSVNVQRDFITATANTCLLSPIYPEIDDAVLDGMDAVSVVGCITFGIILQYY